MAIRIKSTYHFSVIANTQQAEIIIAFCQQFQFQFKSNSFHGINYSWPSMMQSGAYHVLNLHMKFFISIEFVYVVFEGGLSRRVYIFNICYMWITIDLFEFDCSTQHSLLCCDFHQYYQSRVESHLTPTLVSQNTWNIPQKFYWRDSI